MTAAVGPAFLTGAEARAMAERCRPEPRFRAACRWLDGVVRLSDDEDRVDFRVADGGVEALSDTIRDAGPALFGVCGTPEAWDELARGPAASLNRSVREGALAITGDRVAAMRSWLVLFLLVEAYRAVRSRREE